MTDNFVSIRIWGDFACFTRPEMKVERVSYPIITPSAARGILEAIFWEPQMYYIIDSIRVVKKGKWISFKRNEVISKVSLDSVGTWMKNPEKFTPILAGGGAEDGTQRNMLALEDVEYIITAEVNLTDLGKQSNQNIRKYLEEIQRRAKQGKCYHRPALGVREFALDFDWEDDPQLALERRANEMNKDWKTIWQEEELGLMLYDVFDFNKRVTGFRWLTKEEIASTQSDSQDTKKKKVPRHEGEIIQPQAAFFQAIIKESCMNCHPKEINILFK